MKKEQKDLWLEDKDLQGPTATTQEPEEKNICKEEISGVIPEFESISSSVADRMLSMLAALDQEEVGNWKLSSDPTLTSDHTRARRREQMQGRNIWCDP